MLKIYCIKIGYLFFISDMSHTILLLQSTSKLDSRTYSDYESVDECLDGKYKIVIFSGENKRHILLFDYSTCSESFSLKR